MSADAPPCDRADSLGPGATCVLPDPLAIADYLRALYGHETGGDAPGYLSVFTLPDQRTVWFPGDALFGAAPDVIAELAATHNVYHGVALQRARPRNGRGTRRSARAVPGVWFDLDVRGPTHAHGALPASTPEATDFLASLALEPSLVLHSGGGLQVHYLYESLQVLASDDDRCVAETLSRRVQDGIIARGAERGWRLDNTSDLARVLRPAGTLNRKTTEARPVRVIYRSSARYRPRDLIALCVSRPRVRPTAAPQRGALLLGRSSAAADDDRRVRAYVSKLGPRAEGSRDNAAFQLAVWLCNDMALADDLAVGYLREWNAANTPPLADGVLVQKVRRGRRSAARPAGCARAEAA